MLSVPLDCGRTVTVSSPGALLIQLFKYKLIFTRLVVIISGGMQAGRERVQGDARWMDEAGEGSEREGCVSGRRTV